MLPGVIALSAYVVPGKSPLAPLLAPAHRDRVADAVNAAVLAMAHRDSLPPQSTVVSSARRRHGERAVDEVRRCRLPTYNSGWKRLELSA